MLAYGCTCCTNPRADRLWLPLPAGMAGFYRLIAYAVPSMSVANATGGLVRWRWAPPAGCLLAGLPPVWSEGGRERLIRAILRPSTPPR